MVAFIAPKIIGGEGRSTPVGNLGFTQMTSALDVSDVYYDICEKDCLAVGYLPASKGVLTLAKEAYGRNRNRGKGGEGGEGGVGEWDGEWDGEEGVRFFKAWNAWGILSNFLGDP